MIVRSRVPAKSSDPTARATAGRARMEDGLQPPDGAMVAPASWARVWTIPLLAGEELKCHVDYVAMKNYSIPWPQSKAIDPG